MVGFLPLAFGYFLSVLIQSIDPLIADDLMTDLAIGKGTLGMLTAAFPVAFAVCLLPSGIAIDRFGPRAVQSVMMAVTALGALIFSVSTGSFGLMIGRTLLGAGAASALLAAMQAIVTWFPRERLGLVTGCLITVAGLGALAMAGPAALFVHAHGWRALFMLLTAVAALCAILAVLLIPTSSTTGDVPDQDHGLPFVLRDPIFRRFAPLAAIAVGTVWAIQGQWVAGWFAAVSGVKLTAIITYITLIAVGQTIGALVWGALADWAVRKGFSAASVFVGAVALCVCIQLAAVIGIALPTSIVWGVLVAGAAATLPFVVLLTHFPPAYAARACASIGVLQYVATLFIQSAVGGVVAIWPQGHRVKRQRPPMRWHSWCRSHCNSLLWPGSCFLDRKHERARRASRKSLRLRVRCRASRNRHPFLVACQPTPLRRWPTLPGSQPTPRSSRSTLHRHQPRLPARQPWPTLRQPRQWKH